MKRSEMNFKNCYISFRVMRVGFDSLQSIIWQTVKRSPSRKVGGITLIEYKETL